MSDNKTTATAAAKPAAKEVKTTRTSLRDAGGARLDIITRRKPKTWVVFVEHQPKGESVKRGLVTTYPLAKEHEAVAQHNKLRDTAVKDGWALHVRKAAVPASEFTALPKAAAQAAAAEPKEVQKKK